MKYSILLCCLICLQSLSAQNFNEEDFLGSWQLQYIDAKKLPAGVVMKLRVTPETLLISNDIEELNCSWSFSPDNKFIYSSNEKSDEEWQILELASNSLLILDNGKKMFFRKTEIYKAPIIKDPYADVSETKTLERDKLLIGDWKLTKIDDKSADDEDLGLSFRPKGALYYNYRGVKTPAAWALNEDKKSLSIVAFNAVSEQWIITVFTGQELKIFADGKYYSFKRK